MQSEACSRWLLLILQMLLCLQGGEMGGFRRHPHSWERINKSKTNRAYQCKVTALSYLIFRWGRVKPEDPQPSHKHKSCYILPLISTNSLIYIVISPCSSLLLCFAMAGNNMININVYKYVYGVKAIVPNVLYFSLFLFIII